MNGIPLFRTEGKAFQSGQTFTARLFTQLPDLPRANKSDQTRLVEEEYQLGDCLYFFAGHACPNFGDFVFVYGPEMADSDREGSATPFDTGGLHAKHIKIADAVDPKKLCEEKCCTLDCWRASAVSFIDEYFSSPMDYVLGRKPLKDDGTGRLTHEENTRRAWTWEVRIHRDHPLQRDLVEIWITPDIWTAIRQELRRLGTNGQACQKLLREKVIKPAPPHSSPHIEAERSVASCL